MSAVERFLAATDRAVRSGLSLPCLGSYASDGWLSDDEQERVEAALACRPCPGRDFTVVFGKRADG